MTKIIAATATATAAGAAAAALLLSRTLDASLAGAFDGLELTEGDLL